MVTSNTSKYFFVLFLVLPGCFYFISHVRKAKTALNKGDCVKARKHFALAQKKNLKFAEQASQVCEKKALKEALWFYQYLERETKGRKSQVFRKKLADLYFESGKHYGKALELYFSLKEKSVSSSKKRHYSFRIAELYFEMGQWEMSLKALPDFLELAGPERTSAQFLRARIFFRQGRIVLAEREFKKIQKTAPGFFKENKVFLYLSFIHEYRQDFHRAILELEKFNTVTEFLTDKINRLKIRKSNQPGSAFGKTL